jgi:hypothetical protein
LSGRVERSDLVVIAEPADPLARALPPYPRLVRAACETSAAVLYMPHGARRRAGPVVALARASDDAALALAAPVAAALRERLIVLAAGEPASEQDIARAAAALTGRDCATLKVDKRYATSLPDAIRAALAPYRERLLVASRAAVADDLAGFLRLASERAVPLLLAAAA